VTATRRTFVLGDVHLSRRSPPDLGADLARLLASAAGQRVIVAGDLLDLVTDPQHADRARATAALLDAHPRLCAAFGGLLDSGGELVLASGNHDADLGRDELRPALLTAIGATGGARDRLLVTPWFRREGAQGEVHVEHGHFYDPDNAPAHPLVLGRPSLGQHFSTEFLGPTQAHRYLQANDHTPLELLLSAFRWHGPRAPYVVFRYFQAAFAALGRAGPFYRGADEQRAGAALLEPFAARVGMRAELVERMVAVGATPTLASWPATFARLYMDRVAATVLASAGAGALLLADGRPRWRRAAVTSLALGSLVMAASWLGGGDRYRGSVVERLAQAAGRIAATSGARLVVLGHTHREALGERYANTGAFAWPRGAPGRPYLEIEHRASGPRAVRHYLGAATA
jgi:UDP-2,3-diacylglucosamine pyrophosphatase LpxH